MRNVLIIQRNSYKRTFGRSTPRPQALCGVTGTCRNLGYTFATQSPGFLGPLLNVTDMFRIFGWVFEIYNHKIQILRVIRPPTNCQFAHSQIFGSYPSSSPYGLLRVWALIYALHLRCEKFLLGWQGNMVSHYF